MNQMFNISVVSSYSHHTHSTVSGTYLSICWVGVGAGGGGGAGRLLVFAAAVGGKHNGYVGATERASQRYPEGVAYMASTPGGTQEYLGESPKSPAPRVPQGLVGSIRLLWDP